MGTRASQCVWTLGKGGGSGPVGEAALLERCSLEDALRGAGKVWRGLVSALQDT